MTMLAQWKVIDGRPYPQLETVTLEGVVGVYRYHHIAPGEPIPPERFALPEELFEQLSTGGSAPGGRHDAPRFFQVQTREAQPVASVSARVFRAEVLRFAAEALLEVSRYVTEIGAHTEGGPFCRFHRDEGNEVDVEIGIPVSEPIASRGRIASSELPGGRVAMTWALGPYEKLGAVRDDLRDWIAAKHFTPRGGVWEIYWSDPARDRNPEGWRAQVLGAVE